MKVQHLIWESLQETCPTLEEGEVVYLPQVQGPIIGIVVHDTEAEEERWEARLLAGGRSSVYKHCRTSDEAIERVERAIAGTLERLHERRAVPIIHENRTSMENVEVFLLATIEEDEQMIWVKQYHKSWFAVCYSTSTGRFQDYAVQFDSEGIPYSIEAEDFRDHCPAVFALVETTEHPDENEHGDPPLEADLKGFPTV